MKSARLGEALCSSSARTVSSWPLSAAPSNAVQPVWKENHEMEEERRSTKGEKSTYLVLLVRIGTEDEEELGDLVVVAHTGVHQEGASVLRRLGSGEGQKR